MVKSTLKIFFPVLMAGVMVTAGIAPQNPAKAAPPNNTSSPIEIIHATEAEYLTVRETEKGFLVIRGGVQIRMENNLITAQTLRINPATGEILAQGNLRVVNPEGTISGESFYYHPDYKMGVLYSADVKSGPFYIQTQSSARLDSETVISNMARITTCGEENPHYYIKVKKLYISGDKEIAAFGVIYYTGNTPVFYWPFLFQLDEGTGIITRYGYQESRGNLLQNTYYYQNLLQSGSILSPLSAKLMLDWYQKAGWHLGTYAMRQSHNLDYFIHVQVAQYKYRSLLDKGGTEEISNQILRTDGTYGELNELWYKLDFKTRYMWYDSYQKDSYSVLRLNLEEYSHADFDMEYSMRSEPDNTIDALGAGQGFITGPRKDTTIWSVSMEEYYKDSYLLVNLYRQSSWYIQSNSADSRFYPVYEISPEVLYTRNFLLISPIGRYFTGLYNDYRFRGLVEKYYNQGEEIRSTFTGSAETNLRTVFPFTRWFSYHPVLGYSVNTRFSKEQDDALELDNNRNTYRAVTARQSFRTGVPEFYNRIDYRVAYAHYRKEEDPTYRKMLSHDLFTGFYSYLHPYADFSVTTARDLKKPDYTQPERFYWSDVNFSANAFFDFDTGYSGVVRGKDFSTLSQGLTHVYHSHFQGIALHNQYTYSIAYNRSLRNNAGVFYEMGGYAFGKYPRINLLHTGMSWQHDFHDSSFDDAFWEVAAEVILHRFWYLSFGFKSSVYDASRYEKSSPRYISFWEDVYNSSLFFWDSGKESNIVLERVYAVLEHDLHTWIMRLSVWTGKNRLLYGTERRNVAEYYETAVYFSMTLKDIKGFGIPSSQVYRERPSESDFY